MNVRARMTAWTAKLWKRIELTTITISDVNAQSDSTKLDRMSWIAHLAIRNAEDARHQLRIVFRAIQQWPSDIWMETNALARAITSKSPTKLSAASAISPAKNVMVLQRIAQIAVRQQIECSINRIIHAIATQDIIQFPINLCARVRSIWHILFVLLSINWLIIFFFFNISMRLHLLDLFWIKDSMHYLRCE